MTAIRPSPRRLAILLLGVLVLAPSATLGFYADDYVHQLVLRGDDPSAPMRPWALFDFGERTDWAALDGRVGTLPWWTDADWKIRFVRPLSSAALWLQHSVFRAWSPGYHLVSIGLFALLLWNLHGLYQALGLSGRGAVLGTLLFALCDSAMLPVGWISNQNSLLVALFSVASLRLLVDSSAPGKLLLGLLLAIGAVASKEEGAVALALATLVLFRRGEPRARWFGAFAALLSVAYAALFVAGGYGTRSLFYATPWRDLTRWLGNLAVLASAGPVSLLGPYPLDLVGLLPALRVPAIGIGALVSVPVWGWIARAVRGAPGTGLLAVWTVGFLIVQAGAMPSDRLLYVPAIGALGLLATAFDRAPTPWSRRRKALFLSATVGSGLFLLVQGLGLSAGAAFLRESVARTDVGPPAVGRREVYVLQTESQLQAFALHAMWRFQCADQDLAFWNIQSSNRPLRFTRVGAASFEVESLGAPFLSGAFEMVYLTREPAVEVGDRWETAAFQVEARAVEVGRPTRLRFELKRSLDDEGVRFVRPEDGRLAPIDVPAVGESVVFGVPERVGPYMP